MSVFTVVLVARNGALVTKQNGKQRFEWVKRANGGGGVRVNVPGES